jgi:hypothetical protein
VYEGDVYEGDVYEGDVYEGDVYEGDVCKARVEVADCLYKCITSCLRRGAYVMYAKIAMMVSEQSFY